ncbi:MAG: inositol monophosphatase [Flavobacteriia bacterium]|nr:inositol monophosphatase [Flavobacteriia bacterium]
MDLPHVCDQTVHLVREVGAFIRKEQQKVTSGDIELKSLNSLVSYVDKQAEEQLVAGLTRIVPEAGFIAEEGTGERNGNGLNWIVDPLDGTTNFLHGLPVYSVSVALHDGKDLVIGVVLEVGQNECFHAYRGGGAYVNGSPISVSSNATLADSLLATGFPYYDFERMEEYLNLLRDCFQKTRGVRRWGSAAVDLAYVACGRFDGFFEYGLNPWDVAAGTLLVQEAGGKVSAFSPTNDPIFGREILASSSSVYDELNELVREHL